MYTLHANPEQGPGVGVEIQQLCDPIYHSHIDAPKIRPQDYLAFKDTVWVCTLSLLNTINYQRQCRQGGLFLNRH